jgi:hypothetical protein
MLGTMMSPRSGPVSSLATWVMAISSKNARSTKEKSQEGAFPASDMVREGSP